MAEEKGNPKAENFVSKVVKDAKQPPDTLLLMGYPGASSEKGYTRLYFDAQLSNYVEIPDAAILHTQEIPAERSALGGSYIWIDRNAELIHGKVGVDRPKAKFLEGPIFQEFMRGAQFGGAAPPQFGGGQQPSVFMPACPQPTPSAVHLCPQLTLAPTIFICCLPPTLPPACPQLSHLIPFCPPISLPFCPTETCPPSRLFPCPPITLPVCPTEACPPSLLQLCGPAFGGGFGPGAQFGAQQAAPQMQGFGGGAPQQMQQFAFPFPTSPIMCHLTALVCPTSPIVCLQPSVNIPCLPPQTFTWWTPGSIACGPAGGFGQGGGMFGQGAQFGGAAMAQPMQQFAGQQPTPATPQFGPGQLTPAFTPFCPVPTPSAVHLCPTIAACPIVPSVFLPCLTQGGPICGPSAFIPCPTPPWTLTWTVPPPPPTPWFGGGWGQAGGLAQGGIPGQAG